MITVEPIDGIAQVDPATLGQLRAIHEEAFPPEERQLSIDHMLALAGRPGCIFRVVRSDGAAVGYAYLELATEQPVVFLWYLAIEASLRGQGLGRLLVADLLETLRRDHPERRILLLEVHQPGGHGDPPSASSSAGAEEQDRRRIAFYRRLGAWWVQGVEYRIPAAGDGSQSLAYDPMFFPLHDAVDAAEVRRGIVAMAQDSFADSPADPRWLRLQASVAEAVLVPPGGGPG